MRKRVITAADGFAALRGREANAGALAAGGVLRGRLTVREARRAEGKVPEF
jgi:hypothetical protein